MGSRGLTPQEPTKYTVMALSPIIRTKTHSYFYALRFFSCLCLPTPFYSLSLPFMALTLFSNYYSMLISPLCVLVMLIIKVLKFQKLILYQSGQAKLLLRNNLQISVVSHNKNVFLIRTNLPCRSPGSLCGIWAGRGPILTCTSMMNATWEGGWS